jgi:rubrerythrin
MAQAAQFMSEEELLAIAAVLEVEAVRNYRYLAAWWEARGHRELTVLFDRLAAMEAEHVAAARERTPDIVPAVAAEPGKRPAPPDDDAWRSALLTPYAALAFAVREEENAAAFYFRVAAEAASPALRALATTLAGEEREHAALLRRFRRAAFHVARAGAARSRMLPPARDLPNRTKGAADWPQFGK